MAGAAARADEVEITFEAYVLKGGRWLIADIAYDRESALKLGRELVAHKEHDAVKVVRDRLDLRTGRNTEVVIFDSEMTIPPPRPAAEPRPASRPAPRPEPEVRRTVVEPEKGGFPWMALISTVLGLSFTALGFWFIDAIY